MTPQERAKAQERSLQGTGPRIVTIETLHRLEREEAPKHLIKAAQRAIETNPA
jgi:hypothetical protein